MFNEITLVGRLGADPTYKVTGSGKEVCEVSIATTRINKETDWHRITAWEKKAALLRDHTKKGDLILVKGELQISNWEDSEGAKRQKTQVMVRDIKLFPKGNNGSQETETAPRKEFNLKGFNPKVSKEVSFTAADIPF